MYKICIYNYHFAKFGENKYIFVKKFGNNIEKILKLTLIFLVFGVIIIIAISV